MLIQKRYIIMWIAALLSFPAGAQVVLGVRAGAGSSALIQKVEGMYKSGARFGFSVAGLAEIPLHNKFSLRTELGFVNQGGNFYSDQSLVGMAKYNKCNYYSIHVPVDAAFSFHISDVIMTVQAGPALDWSLFGKLKTENTDVDLKFGTSEEKDLKTFDLCANLGLAVEYNKMFFSIVTDLGTLDRRSTKRSGETSVYQNNVTFSLGYYFR